MESQSYCSSLVTIKPARPDRGLWFQKPMDIPGNTVNTFSPTEMEENIETIACLTREEMAMSLTADIRRFQQDRARELKDTINGKWTIVIKPISKANTCSRKPD